MNCIYCKTELTPQTRWAHIWPRAIGGRLKSREICCDSCNNTIGRVEDNLRESLSHAFASVGATTDEREPIAVAIEFNGHGFELAAGNAIMEVGGRRFDREKKQMIVPLPAGFDRQVELLAKAMHSHGLGPEAAMTLGLVPGDPEPELPAGPVHHEHDLKLGGSVEHKRVFVKMALELLAYHRHDLATRGELSEARRFARHGTGTFRGRPDTRSEGSSLIHGVALPRVYNAIEVWSFGTVVFFRVVFIGPIVFTGTLTTEWSAEAFRAAYAFDARDPSKSLVSDLLAGDGPNLAVWFHGMVEESIEAMLPAIETISFEVASSAVKIERDAPPDLDKLRVAVAKRLAEMPSKKHRAPR